MSQRERAGENRSFRTFRNHRFKLLVLATLLIAIVVGIYVLDQTLSRSEINYPREPGYRYEQIASVDAKTLTRLGVKSTWTHSDIWSVNGSVYNLTEVTVSYSGNFTLHDTVVDYSLYSHSYNSHYRSNNSSRIYFTLFIIFFTNSPSKCDLASPRSEVNCNEILLIDVTNPQTSPPLHMDILAPPYQPSERFAMLNDTEVPNLLDSHLTLILATFQGSSSTS